MHRPCIRTAIWRLGPCHRGRRCHDQPSGVAVQPSASWISAGTCPAPISRCSALISVDEHGTEREFLPVVTSKAQSGARYGVPQGLPSSRRCPARNGSWSSTSSPHHETVELGRGGLYGLPRPDPRVCARTSPGWPRKPVPILPIRVRCSQRPSPVSAHMNPDAIALYQSHSS